MGVGGVVLVGLAALAVVVAVLAHRAEPFLRARIVEGLQSRFHARVELDSFHISFGNELKGRWGIWAEGHGLRIWPSAEAQARRGQETEAELANSESGGKDAPLIRLQTFRFHTPLRYERDKPITIALVQIEGLDIDVPPRSHNGPKPPASGGTAATDEDAKPIASPVAKAASLLSTVIVNRIECKGARLVLETDRPGKLPLGFDIAHISLSNVTADGPFDFTAELTNPLPLGNIQTTGSFGPWQAADPGASPVKGDYKFDHADLGDFKGIAGILSSTGHYEGTLRNIVVDGETETPDFRLTAFGTALPLHTRFHARVDGTDGDTWLDPVNATLGGSHFTAQGKIVRFLIPMPHQNSESSTEKESPFRGGHEIALTVNVDRGRIEDFLRLCSKGGPPLLTGGVTVKTTLHIPAEKPDAPRPIQERIQLKGHFTLNQVVFSREKIQDGIRQLSLRGQGRPKDMKTTDASSIDSTMDGDFQMQGAVITLPELTYSVEGAAIHLSGTYGVEGGALNFTGNAKMQATVSAMVGGWKGLLLSPLDRYLRKDGAGTEVPIYIRGTRDQPKFGVDFGKMLSKPQAAPSAPKPFEEQPEEK